MENIKSIYDYSLLRGKIKTVYGAEKNFAADMGFSDNTLSRKFNPKKENEGGFTQKEIDKACFLLSIPPTEIHSYFFTKKVENIPTN